MDKVAIQKLVLTVLLIFSMCACAGVKVEDPLPSWNEGAAKKSILAFVKAVTDKNSSQYIKPQDRIATFDNDGCLWSEKPVYFQLLFAFDRIKKLAPEYPEWKTQEPFASILKSDYEKTLAAGEKALMQVIAASHGNVSADEFSESVRAWLEKSQHPKTKRPYNEMIFQPMLELLDYLRENEFKTFIVSGGGVDFLRVFAEEAYGIPPQQVVGSSMNAKYEVIQGVPTIVKLPDIGFIDDKAGKPVGIHQHIGKRPVFAAGNSDGDFQMLEWTTAGEGARFGLLVHHTDSEREWAYDRKSAVGALDKGLDEADKRGWVVVDMKSDWKVVYPFNK